MANISLDYDGLNNNSFNRLNDTINSFYGNSNLQSIAWDEYKKIIGGFQESIQELSTISNDINNLITNLNKSISNCLNSYSGKITYPGKYSSDPEVAIGLVHKEISVVSSHLNSVLRHLNEVQEDKDMYNNILGEYNSLSNSLRNLRSLESLLSQLIKIKNSYGSIISQIKSDINNIDF